MNANHLIYQRALRSPKVVFADTLCDTNNDRRHLFDHSFFIN